MMPGPAMPPAAGGAMTDDQLLDMATAIESMSTDIVAGGAPQPNTPYKGATLEKLRDAVNAFAANFEGLEPVEFVFEPRDGVGGATDWNEPMPPELFSALMAISEAMTAANMDGAFEQYMFDPMSLIDEKTLKGAIASINAAAADKALIEALGAPAEGAPMEEPVEDEMDADMYLGGM